MALRLLYSSRFDTATITANTSTGDLVAGNVAHPYVSKVWRSTGNTSEWVKFDLGSAQTITAVAIIGHNLSSTATLTLQGNATDSWGAPTVNTVQAISTDGDGRVVNQNIFFLNNSLRWWRILITDASLSYIQIGRIMGGAYWEPTRYHNDGWQIVQADPSEGRDQPGRQSAWKTRCPFRVSQFTVTATTQAEADKWLAVYRQVGRSVPFVITFDTSSASRINMDSLYGQFKSEAAIIAQLATVFNVATMSFEEKTE